MIDLIKQHLKIPDSCLVDKKIFKKMFYENYKFTSQDKKIFKDEIDSIHWLYSIKPENSNVAEFVDEIFEYREVAFLAIDVLKATSIKKIGRIEEIVHRSIPYGTVLFIFDSENFIISCSEKRLSNLTKDGLVVDKIISTNPIQTKDYLEYLDGFVFSSFSLSNLKQFNLSVIEKVVGVISLQRLGYNHTVISNPIEKKNILDSIVEYENKVDALKRELQLETQFNKKMEINVMIKNIETHIIELKKQIS